MKKLLMVLYQFPPCNDVGSYRPVKFIKNLETFGWYPIVLTPRNGVYFSYDSKAENAVRKKCTVYRSSFLLPFNFLRELPMEKSQKLHKLLWRVWNRIALPDGAASWIPSATLEGLRLVEKEGVEVVFASGQPFSTFIIACLIKRLSQNRDLKLILDYRDPWILNPFYKGSKIRRECERRLEEAVLRQADAVVAVSDEALDFQYHGFKNSIGRDKLHVITNSFEGNSLKHQADIQTDTQADTQREKFVIVHAGNFYGTRNPEIFLKGLSLAATRNKNFAHRVKVYFYGNYDHQGVQKIIHELQITSLVNLCPRIPQNELVQRLLEADLLLLINSYGPGHDIFIPAKFFDYLKIRKPILCLAEDGALKRAVQKTHAGTTVDPRDHNQAARTLEELYNRISVQKIPYTLSEDNIREYESYFTTGKLAALCDRLLTH
ncbi:MAG: hypothetical protein AB1611_11605 [bacterium]